MTQEKSTHPSDESRRPLSDRLLDTGTLLWVFLAVALLVTIQQLVGTWVGQDGGSTRYNNFLIFKWSFFHLVEGKDLYVLHLTEHLDHYKYSPAFALLLAPIAILPDTLGLLAWNSLNVVAVYVAIARLPEIGTKAKAFMLWFVLIELITSIQNTQSNGLMTGLIVLAFGLLESRRVVLASLLLALSAYLKPFGLAAFPIILLYPWRAQAIAWSALWMAALALLPLVAVSPGELRFLYGSWFDLMASDLSRSQGMSVMGWLRSWFGLDLNRYSVVLVGVVLLLSPLLKLRSHSDFNYRLLALGCALIFMVIFNHMAESPTFIVAVTGVAIWYFSQARRTENLILLLLTFVLTSLSPTEIFPSYLDDTWVRPYSLKAVPCIVIFGKILWEMVQERPRLAASEALHLPLP